jgi:alpha-L-arabinofuranosidase
MALAAGRVAAQADAPVRIDVDATKQIATVTELFNGTNIEDLNNQTNGGMFSQLLHGEAFEEGIDVDFLDLDRKDYSKVYVVLDERRIPHLLTQSDIYSRIGWNNLSEKYDFNSADIYSAGRFRTPHNLSGWLFPGRFLVFDSLPAAIRRTMLDRIDGNEQVTKYWSKTTSGNPSYRYTLVRDGKAWMGRQTQRVAFTGGSGEVGIVNHGLYRSGIMLDSGKPYDGVIRVKADAPTEIFVSLRDEAGEVLAEKPCLLKGNGSYEKVAFELTPDATAARGSFAIALKAPGEIDLGFAFLQPGEWGRVPGGWPIRTMFTDALRQQGITAFRYNGSMVDVGADTHLYRWKKMRGPVDERRVTFRSGFNAYATHSFGFIEMLQAAEAIDAVAIIGMSMNESAEDIRDFVEYVNGPVSSEWGALRAADGHPEPYGLKYIQVDNERGISRGYVEAMKKFALAAWEADPEMSIMTSLNIGGEGYRRDGPEWARRQYELSSELAGWFIDRGKGGKLAWDPHYSGALDFADRGDRYLNEMGINLQAELAKDYPGFWLNLHPMEENGFRCDWDRGLAHAHNWNTNQRHGDSFRMLGTANTFQPHGLHYMWDQGRIHYSSDAIWFQPSAHIDAMIMESWKPRVVEAVSSNDAVLDVTAKVSDDGTEMTLCVVNLADRPIDAVINIAGFRFGPRAQMVTIGGCDLTEFNTYENRENVVPVRSRFSIARRDAACTFPKYSYTMITLKR